MCDTALEAMGRTVGNCCCCNLNVTNKTHERFAAVFLCKALSKARLHLESQVLGHRKTVSSVLWAWLLPSLSFEFQVVICVFLISTFVDQENYLWTLIFICFTNHVHVLFSKFQTRVKYKKLTEQKHVDNEHDKMKHIAIVLHHQNLTWNPGIGCGRYIIVWVPCLS